MDKIPTLLVSMLLLFFSCLVMASNANSGTDLVEHQMILNEGAKLQSLNRTEMHSIYSGDIKQTYYLHVYTPELRGSENNYPVIYLLDGGLTYPMLTSYHHTLALLEELPQAIIVGVGYGHNDWRKGNMRSRDYTAPSAEKKHWGGANRFLSVLSNKIIPYIERRYNVNGQRLLFGNSLGGQFGIYVASNAPRLFDAIVVNNPALHTNTNYFIKQLNNAKEGSGTVMFIGMADLDEQHFIDARNKWFSAIDELDTAPWTMKKQIFNGHSHMSSIPVTYRAGLLWFFNSHSQ